MGRFEEVYRRSLADPEGFWADAAAAIDWDEPWERVLDDSRAPFYRWFSGGRLNTCHNALDRHPDQLPDAGLKGNTHIPFADMNNVAVADLLSKFLAANGLDKR